MCSDFTAYIKYIKAFSTLAQVDIVTLPSGYESRSQIRHGEFRIQEPESNSSQGIWDPGTGAVKKDTQNLHLISVDINQLTSY